MITKHHKGSRLYKWAKCAPNIFHLAILTCLTFTLIGCGRKWKQPSDVKFNSDIEVSSGLGGKLLFSSGFITIKDFRFDGDRERGDDVRFDYEYSSGLNVPLDLSATVSELEFNIPQGVYKRVDIDFSVNDSLGIAVNGVYEYSGGGTIPFKFQFSDSQNFEIRAENDNGGDIVLDKDVASRVKILLDPAYWFELISIVDLDAASTVSILGISTLLISEDVNSDIYDDVTDRVDESNLIVFNY